jgi:hypothetical protein
VGVVAVPPGRSRPYREAEWRDALVLVERGEIELESRAGAFAKFGEGDLLSFTGLPLRSLRNRGRKPALLVALTRSDEFRRKGRS